jgi:hypothetical protein
VTERGAVVDTVPQRAEPVAVHRGGGTGESIDRLALFLMRHLKGTVWRAEAAQGDQEHAQRCGQMATL